MFQSRKPGRALACTNTSARCWYIPERISNNPKASPVMKVQYMLLRCVLPALLSVTSIVPAQTLTVTDGLALWLRADMGVTTNEGGLVLQWDDQSGNLNHASQPTELQMPLFVPNAITNKPALRFDGSANAGEHDFLNIPHAESLAFAGNFTTLF